MSTANARQLRSNLTDAEQALWKHLRLKQIGGCKFRRQQPIGNYIVDFVCFERKLVIELDGGQHNTPSAYEDNRTAWINSQGFMVMRFWNHDVLKEIDAVKQAIWDKLFPPPQSSPTRGEEGSALASSAKRKENSVVSSFPPCGGRLGWGEEGDAKLHFNAACEHIAGGVNSPVRAFKAVGGTPLFIERGAGARIFDTAGRGYLDYVLSWGPLILGHAHPEVVAAIEEAARRGTSFGAPTERETRLAALIKQAIPAIEQLRLVSSGTEATMSAIRLARGVTGRDVVVKFDGCYHGHGDSLLVKAGSGAATFGVPGSAGVPQDLARLTRTLPYNDLSAVETLLAAEGESIACVILEPIAGNMGVIVPDVEFLQAVRALTQRYGILLIFDEVMTGFRVAWGGAQAHFGIIPDLTCLGKIVGGGLPLAAFGGRADIMQSLAPEGPVYQAGTLSGNPVAVAAGLTTLAVLEREGEALYAKLEQRTQKLTTGLRTLAQERRWPLTVQQIASMFTVFVTRTPVRNFADAHAADTQLFAKLFHALLKRGVYITPSQFEANFLSTAHTDADITHTLAAWEAAGEEVLGRG